MTCRSRSALALSLIVTLLVVRQLHAQHSAMDLDQLVPRAMETFDVPGIGVAIVKDGQVIRAAGYGVRQLGGNEPVNAATLFPVASNTKAFTAVALGMLVDRGEIAWSDRVIKHLPSFRMSNDYVTSELTVTDLLVHRSGLGLGAGDLLFWPPTTHSRDELVRRLRFVPLQTSFRSAYAYDNVLYAVAGEVIEKASGKSWEEFIRTEIMDKVGMPRSRVKTSDLADAENAATPHAPIDNELVTVAAFDLDNANPAAGIISSAEEMARWQLVLLRGGTLENGERLYSDDTAKRLWTLVTPIPIGSNYPGPPEAQPNFNGYALGFGVRDYRGKKMVSHTGGLPGFVSLSMLVPELDLGVVVLTNQESGAAFRSIGYSIVDHFLGADTDWVAAYQSDVADRKADVAEADKKTEDNRDADSGPSLELSRYAGEYEDAWYGKVIMTHEDGGGLRIAFAHTPVLQGRLEHWQHDTFVARWDDRELRADAFVTFALNPDGTIDLAKMKAVSDATDFSFDFHDLILRPSLR